MSLIKLGVGRYFVPGFGVAILPNYLYWLDARRVWVISKPRSGINYAFHVVGDDYLGALKKALAKHAKLDFGVKCVVGGKLPVGIPTDERSVKVRSIVRGVSFVKSSRGFYYFGVSIPGGAPKKTVYIGNARTFKANWSSALERALTIRAGGVERFNSTYGWVSLNPDDYPFLKDLNLNTLKLEESK